MIQTSPGIYAHTLKGHGELRWEPLDTHLLEVAELAGTFADAFGARDFAWIAGRCHELGKGSDAFQQYIRNKTDAANAGEEESSSRRTGGPHLPNPPQSGAPYPAAASPDVGSQNATGQPRDLVKPRAPAHKTPSRTNQTTSIG